MSLLKNIKPDLKIRTDKTITQGDRDNRPFFAMNSIGVFEKEVNEKLLKFQADFAVHSLKDLHAGISDKLVIASIPKRERPNDVFINSIDFKKLDQLPPGSTIGTSSIRRALQIKTRYPHLKIKSIRGNVETRLNRSKEKKYSGIILAEAGIDRLGLVNHITQRLNIRSFTPAPGQGALAIVCRKEDTELLTLLKKIEHVKSLIEVQAERSLTDAIGAGCTVPLGALALTQIKQKRVSLYAVVYSLDGRKSIKVGMQHGIDYPQELGKMVADELVSRGAKEITKEWNNNNNNNMNIDVLNELIE
nr:hydroxymethylbilane synthase [Candidatus Nitrosocosmicus hydrocola]